MKQSILSIITVRCPLCFKCIVASQRGSARFFYRMIPLATRQYRACTWEHRYTFFSYKNSFYKNIKAWTAEKIRTLKALNFSKINVVVKLLRNKRKFQKFQKNICFWLSRLYTVNYQFDDLGYNEILWLKKQWRGPAFLFND